MKSNVLEEEVDGNFLGFLACNKNRQITKKLKRKFSPFSEASQSLFPHIAV